MEEEKETKRGRMKKSYVQRKDKTVNNFKLEKEIMKFFFRLSNRIFLLLKKANVLIYIDDRGKAKLIISNIYIKKNLSP